MTRVASAASLALVLFLSVGTFVAVSLRADTSLALGTSDWAAIRFTFVQAALSSAISCLLAVPVARAVARRNFPGRSLLITLLGAPFILPTIVAIVGILAVFGSTGLLGSLVRAVGIRAPEIYGLHGVVLAHVFFNLPLATRFVLQGWLAVPSERLRTAAALGFGPREVFTHIERPMLRSVLPGALVVVFLVCLSSFAVALIMGGGPRATTIELAIYQAFMFEFDVGRAARLALIQFMLGICAGIVAWRVALPTGFGAGLDRPAERWDARRPGLRLADGLVITAVSLFLLLPLGTVLIEGFGEMFRLPSSVYFAAARSLAVALASVLLMLALALPIALAVSRTSQRQALLAEGAGLLMIAASPMVVGLGLYIILFPLVDPISVALAVTALVNAGTSLPFALRAIIPAVRDAEVNFGSLADSLGLNGAARVRLLILPRTMRPLGFAMGITAALSMGDLGVIALFGSTDAPTLPLMLYRLMGAYRMEQASGAALLLVLLSILVFWTFDRGGRINSAS
ncbi:MAG: thiamine/thiamine pyrophosphate ABC transporter permease ThiP [Rhodobacteraceae bacterium]|nr:thiamine/thiamine pyrophosphate ABC transporter permease ThiP [Paracoccaceae bacterium]